VLDTQSPRIDLRTGVVAVVVGELAVVENTRQDRASARNGVLGTQGIRFVLVQISPNDRASDQLSIAELVGVVGTVDQEARVERIVHEQTEGLATVARISNFIAGCVAAQDLTTGRGHRVVSQARRRNKAVNASIGRVGQSCSQTAGLQPVADLVVLANLQVVHNQAGALNVGAAEGFNSRERKGKEHRSVLATQTDLATRRGQAHIGLTPPHAVVLTALGADVELELAFKNEVTLVATTQVFDTAEAQGIDRRNARRQTGHVALGSETSSQGITHSSWERRIHREACRIALTFAHIVQTDVNVAVDGQAGLGESSAGAEGCQGQQRGLGHCGFFHEGSCEHPPGMGDCANCCPGPLEAHFGFPPNVATSQQCG